MDFVTNMLGLLLLIVCILIVLIFLKDYIRLSEGPKITDTVKKDVYVPHKYVSDNRKIMYKVYYNNQSVQDGEMNLSQLPVQFGGEYGSGNDIVIAPSDVSERVLQAVNSVWFFVQKDAMGQLMIYSADKASNGNKRASASKKLFVGNDQKAVRSMKLDSEAVLRAGEIRLVLSVEEQNR